MNEPYEPGERQQISLAAPPADPQDLKSVPQTELVEGTLLWRVTTVGRQPWWFSNSMGGRFDLQKPWGTCYLATDPLTAVLEIIGPNLTQVSEEFLQRRLLYSTSLVEKKLVVDLTARALRGLGMTHEVHSVVPYKLPQAWAKVFFASGAEGLLYLARHDPSVDGRCLALFGPEGEQGVELDPEGISPCRSCVDPGLVQALEDTCGLRVFRRPHRGELVVEN